MFDEVTEIALLYDFYGRLLTEKQQMVWRFSHEEDYSLSEIAAELGISRQGVYDALKNAEHALRDYEQKLGLVEKFGQTRQVIGSVDHAISELIAGSGSSPELVGKLTGIKNVIDNLEL